MEMEYEPSSVRVEHNGVEVPLGRVDVNIRRDGDDRVVHVPSRTTKSIVPLLAMVSAFWADRGDGPVTLAPPVEPLRPVAPDTIVVHPQYAARIIAAMVVTPDDEARIARAKAKRERKAAARKARL